MFFGLFVSGFGLMMVLSLAFGLGMLRVYASGSHSFSVCSSAASHPLRHICRDSSTTTHLLLFLSAGMSAI